MDRTQYFKDYRAKYRASTKTVWLTLTPDDYKRVAAIAKRDKLPVATLAREVLLASLEHQTYLPAELVTELQSFNRLIRNIASNINQLAHHSNTIRQAADTHAVFAELDQLRQRVDSYTRGRL